MYVGSPQRLVKKSRWKREKNYYVYWEKIVGENSLLFFNKIRFGLLDLRSSSLVMNAKSVEWDTNSDAILLLLFYNYYACYFILFLSSSYSQSFSAKNDLYIEEGALKSTLALGLSRGI